MTKKQNNIIYFFFLLASLFFLIFNNLDLNIIYIIFLISAYLLSVVPIIYYLKNFDSYPYLPIFPLVNIYFIFCYLSIFFFNKNLILNIGENTFLQKSDIEYAIKIFLYGYISFLVGFYFIIHSSKKINRKGIKFFELQNKEILMLGLLFTIPNIIFFYLIKIQLFFPAISQLKYPSLLMGIGLLVLYININLNKLFNLKNLFCIFLVSFPLILEILTGALSFPFMVLFVIFIFVAYIQKKLFLLPIFLISFAFIFLHAGKYEYRKLTSQNFNSNSELNKIKIFYNIYKNVISESKDKFNEIIICNYSNSNNFNKRDCKLNSDLKVQKRITHSFSSLIHVTKLTTNDQNLLNTSIFGFNYVPFWDGYSYHILYSKLIPRILWKNKPEDNLGNEFGHRYNVLTKYNSENNLKKDTVTSWNMPVLNEFYVNFGIKGVIFGMFLIGFMFGTITKLGTLQNIKNIEFIVFFFLIIPIFFLESHLSLLFGAIIQSYFFLIFVSYILLIFIRKFT